MLQTDKNSIVQMAAQELRQLQGMKEELERQNEELRSRVEEKERGLSKVRIRVTNPSSPIDSIVEVLKCLTRMNLRAKVIGSEFSDGEFSAMFEIESKVPKMFFYKIFQNCCLAGTLTKHIDIYILCNIKKFW